MRLILLALLPAALAACGNEASSDRETMPAPGPTMEEAAGEASGDAGTDRQIQAEAMEGEWSSAADRGDPSASFSSNDETLLTLICRSSTIEGEGSSLVVQRAIPENQAGDTIDFLTSAGNVSVDAVALDMDTPMVGGTIDAGANGMATLANAGDVIRVQTGDDEIVVPASDAMKAVVNDCRPEPEAEPEDDEDVAEDTEEAETP